jgi:hypothetical protein
VKFVVHGAQPRFEHVRVDLRRREIRMTEHELNHTKVGASFEQMRRERMAQHMGAQIA